ncbi:MAG: hypothetical protein V2J12_11810, partial [Gammaproteobacteria bacterium]|nr:hypothetical protein [Gammaproteobacteria bacterium]
MMRQLSYTRWLTALLALQLVLAAAVWWPARTEPAGSAALLDFAPEQIDRVRVADTGQTVELRKTARGWITAGPGSVPVATARVEGLLNRMA